jgi:Glycosyl transferase family 90
MLQILEVMGIYFICHIPRSPLDHLFVAIVFKGCVFSPPTFPQVLSRWQIPDVDMVICSADGPQPPPRRKDPCWEGWGPLLSFCKSEDQDYAILIPDNTFGDNPEIFVPGWRHMQAFMVQASLRMPLFLGRNGMGL